MKHVSIDVRADWDDEVNVWVATSNDIEGMCIEASTVEALKPKVAAAIRDLLELNGPRLSVPDILITAHPPA